MQRFKLITNARVVDVEAGRVSAPQNIAIQGGRIDRLFAGPVDPPDEKIDADGAYVCPGLIDCHVHLFLDAGDDPLRTFLISDHESKLRTAAANAARALAAGITTIRDCGGPADLVFRVQRMIRDGEIAGPAIIAAGAPITRVGGHCHFFGGEVADKRDVRLCISRQARMGAKFVKLIASGGGLTPGTSPYEADLSLDLLREAVLVAHACGLHVSAHCHATESIVRALDAGVDIIEHAGFVQPDSPPRFDRDIAARMVDQGTVVSPTAISGMRIAEKLRQSAGPVGFDPAAIERLEARRHHAARFYEAGVSIIAGSDCGVAGTAFDSLIDELIAYSSAGIPIPAALRAATSDSARYLGQPLLGQVASGFAADLVFLNRNPLEDLSALKEPDLVLRKGVIVCDRRRVPASVS
jgi:imidazolonepropionase-like amidohydrolase